MDAPLDRTDRRLLAALQDDARLTVAELAERVALSPSPCWRRVRRLEQAGVISGYHARLDAGRLGLGITAFVSVVMGSHTREVARAFEAAVQDIPEVIACHNVSGEYDFLLEVVAPDLAAYGEFARSVLQALPGVRALHSSFALKPIKTARRLPIPGA
ncbi:Lrp/AsnC family transcriptional regulator [Thermomonas flagellata]|jgi:DNA-binding Lrp family transcriptional regulator|uniref:Lrp/AsnC family transcriptional regulator n=1 Tax=Thermomonas flagellata TaxID=2888524 RepID=UPI001F039C6F|nr:Lrp/AsnC family transcriptional regulator [Thermomonas flagellata]